MRPSKMPAFLPSGGSGYFWRSDFELLDSTWEFRPLSCLHGVDLYDYFLRTFEAANFKGTVDHYGITSDKPTIWQVDFTPEGGFPRHLDIEHDDLTPEKLRGLLD